MHFLFSTCFYCLLKAKRNVDRRENYRIFISSSCSMLAFFIVNYVNYFNLHLAWFGTYRGVVLDQIHLLSFILFKTIYIYSGKGIYSRGIR